MNIIISLIYAPIVFYFIKNSNIETVAISIFTFSALWFILTLKRGIKEYIFPIFYILISFLAYFLDSYILLKSIPLLISILILLFIFYTYITNNSFIFYFLEKFNKKVDEREKQYIQKCTLFWAIVSLFNVIIHFYVLNLEEEKYWMMYSSFAWYFLFIFAGLIQAIHKKIYFQRK